MPNYLVEAYAPEGSELEELVERARSADADGVRHVRSIFLPEDETCFHLFEGGCEADVVAASMRVGLQPHRVVEAET